MIKIALTELVTRRRLVMRCRSKYEWMSKATFSINLTFAAFGTPKSAQSVIRLLGGPGMRVGSGVSIPTTRSADQCRSLIWQSRNDAACDRSALRARRKAMMADGSRKKSATQLFQYPLYRVSKFFFDRSRTGKISYDKAIALERRPLCANAMRIASFQ
jgi:hypothetical protein